MLQNTPRLSVKTEVFEGPLELLIELVERRKLLINDISLAAVTDEYLKQVSEMQERSLPNTAHFVALAATLLLIKSKSLLPALTLTTEEETLIDTLEDRLRRYQLYRDVAKDIALRYGQNMLFEQQFSPPRITLFLPDEQCTLESLATAIKRVVENLPQKQFKPQVKVKPVISLEEMIDRFRLEIERRVKTTFSRLSANETERKVLIVGFLALLELFKQGDVRMNQSGRFADIEIEITATGTPRYY